MVNADQYRAMALQHHRWAGMCRSPESREEHFRLEKELALADNEERLHGLLAPAQASNRQNSGPDSTLAAKTAKALGLEIPPTLLVRGHTSRGRLTPRFRTFQVCPKDLPATLRQDRRGGNESAAPMALRTSPLIDGIAFGGGLPWLSRPT
jgi:hypothetical protein